MAVTISAGVLAADIGRTHAPEHTSPTYFGTIFTSTGVFVPAARVLYAHPIDILWDSVSENRPVVTTTFVLT
jgi:hypothetical protein